jgi:hypothetical protein
LEKLDTLYEKDPTEYWKLVKDLKDEDSSGICDPCDKVKPSSWTNYFSSLFTVRKEFINLNDRYEKLLAEKENFRSFTPLDCLITQKEVSRAISKLSKQKVSWP